MGMAWAGKVGHAHEVFCAVAVWVCQSRCSRVVSEGVARRRAGAATGALWYRAARRPTCAGCSCMPWSVGMVVVCSVDCLAKPAAPAAKAGGAAVHKGQAMYCCAAGVLLKEHWRLG